jgi:hypothetical protein
MADLFNGTRYSIIPSIVVVTCLNKHRTSCSFASRLILDVRLIVFVSL